MAADQSRPVTGYPASNSHPNAATSYPASNGHPNVATPYPASNGYPNAAAAYSYGAPPQQNQGTYFNVSGNPFYADTYAPRQRATFVRRIFAVIVGTVLITGSIIFIMWLILRPKVPQLRVDTLTLSNFSMSSNSLVSGNWDARFTVRNPNSKITLYYDHIEAALFFKSESISKTTVPPFVQGKKTETAVRATFASLSAYVDDRNGIYSERARGIVNFDLRMLARVRFKAGAWWSRRRILNIFCPALSVGVSANSTGGSLVGGSKPCRVRL